MDGWMDGRVDGWIDGWVGGWMDGLMDGWKDGRTDRFEFYQKLRKNLSWFIGVEKRKHGLCLNRF